MMTTAGLPGHAGPPRSSDVAADTIRVLLVVPQKMVETGLLLLFGESEDFVVVGSASSGREALALARKLHPTVVIVDEGLPDIAATQVIARLRSDSADVKVLLLSSDTSWRSVVRVFRAGAWGFVAKERSFGVLKAALRTISLGRHFIDGETGGRLAVAWCELPGMGMEIALASLSERENEVFHLFVEGKSVREISKGLFISRKTVETHRRAILRKLKVRDVAELTKFAIRHHLLNP